MYVGSCKQRYETNLVPSQSNKATIRICFQSSTSLSDLCLTPFCSPLYPHLDSDLSDLPCSAAAAVLPQRALASKQLARELWPVHRKKKPLSDPTWARWIMGWREKGRVSRHMSGWLFLSDGWRKVQRDAAPAVDSPMSSAGPPRGRGDVGGEGRVAGTPYNWQEMIGGRLHTHSHTFKSVCTCS